MAIENIKCPNCGGMVQLDDSLEKGFCMYCGGAIQIKKEITKIKVEQVVNALSVDSCLKRAFMFLEDKDWKSADEYCEKALDIDPECAKAYIGKLMASIKVSREVQLGEQREVFENNSYFQKALQFADEEFRQTLKGYIADTLNYIEKRKIALEKYEEEKRKQEEKKQTEAELNEKRLYPVRQRIRPAQNLISAGDGFVCGVTVDGKVVSVFENTDSHDMETCMTSWEDIIAISASISHVVGLKSNGTVLAVGNDTYKKCAVSDWESIVSISTGPYNTVGLKSNGTVVAVGNNSRFHCNVNNWKDIIAISSGHNETFGLRSDGTVVFIGEARNFNNWENIVGLTANIYDVFGLKSDGTVIDTDENSYGVRNSDGWKEIVAISAGNNHIVGLKSDGTVVAAGQNYHGECNVSGWNDIVAISAGKACTVGLKSDGTVVAVGFKNENLSKIKSWKLFNNVNTIEQERKNIINERQKEISDQLKIKAQRRQNGICQHCGATFKGLFTKKCSACGREKDY